MRKFVFATNNAHKLEEVRSILKNQVEILSLEDIGCVADIPETADTLEGNALLKAQYIKKHYQLDCFADDTGLEIEALEGKPGVYSARYAGEDCHPEDNMKKVLEELKEISHRQAQFRTVIALLQKEETKTFEGAISGTITSQKQGEDGFGYDPIFQPKGYSQTFAQMGSDEKNKISHRALAVKKLCDFLKQS